MLGDEDYLPILLGQYVHDQSAEGLNGQQEDDCTGGIEYEMGIGNLLSSCASQVLDEQGEVVYEGQKEQNSKEIEEKLGSGGALGSGVHVQGYDQSGG